MSQLQIDLTDIISQAVRSAVEKKTKEITERAKLELEHEIPKVVAGVVLEFQKYITINTHGEQIMITIRMPSKGEI